MPIESTIIYQINTSINREIALKNIATETLEKLQEKFANEYEIIPSEMAEVEKDWAHDISIRKGKKIGAEVSLKWEKGNGEIVSVEVDESSKLGNQITYITLLVFILTGAYLAYNDMPPLEFLPGRRMAAGLGGLIFIIPAIPVLMILKSVFLKKEKEINAALVNEVKATLQN